MKEPSLFGEEEGPGPSIRGMHKEAITGIQIHKRFLTFCTTPKTLFSRHQTLGQTHLKRVRTCLCWLFILVGPVLFGSEKFCFNEVVLDSAEKVRPTKRGLEVKVVEKVSAADPGVSGWMLQVEFFR